LNTGQTFNIGSNYDLFSVAMHELGHALGLNHSSSSSAIMYASYTNTKSGLNSDDSSGIQAVYNGARKPDAYDAAAANNSFSTASNITSTIDPTAKTAVLPNLDLTTTKDVDYYKFTAPAGSTTLSLVVQSKGLRLLSPKVTVYNASQKQLATVGGPGPSGSLHAGATLNLKVNVTAGQVYYLLVAGAETSSSYQAFNVGRYALVLNLGSGSTPSVPLPNTQTPNGNPLTSGGGQAEHAVAVATRHGQVDRYGAAPARRPAHHHPAPRHPARPARAGPFVPLV